ncbi:DUF4982 domain-containing protein [Bacteroides sp. OttesenSCG-928-D19]|nr:DUF4982 domain-containing protein [Bacteroides sp. OttesenSCG-928-D19]
MLHIASRDWEHCSGLQTGNNPVVMPVKVYTNLHEVDLFVDGKSLGKKANSNYTAVFDVPFTGGKHTLHVKAVHNSETI